MTPMLQAVARPEGSELASQLQNVAGLKFRRIKGSA